MYILPYLIHIMLAYLYKLFCTYLHLLYSNIYCNSFSLYGAPFGNSQFFSKIFGPSKNGKILEKKF